MNGAAPARILLPALLLILALLPPETRGESMAGCAGLIALGTLIGSRSVAPARVLPLLVLLAAAVPLVLVADAPGPAVEPLAAAFLAGSLGISLLGFDRSDRSRLPWAIAAAGALVSSYALYQLVWGLENTATQLETAGVVADKEAMLARLREGRAFALFATPAALGGFLALALPATIGAALDRCGRARSLLIALAAAQAAGLVAAASATATAALAGALALAAIGTAAVRGRAGRLPWRAWLVAISIALALVSAVAVLRGAGVVDPTEPRGPWQLRAGNFRLAAVMALDHPWLGVGPGGFGEAYPRYRRSQDNETQHAHNLPLELAAEIGLAAGLLVSALFFYLFLVPALRGFDPAGSCARYGVAIGLAAFALQNLGDFTAFLPALLWTASALRGWLARPVSVVEPVGSRALAGTLPFRAILVSATMLAAALCGLGGLGSNQRQAAREALVRGELENAAARARLARSLAPWNPDGWLIGAEIEMRSERLEPARQHVERAIALTPVRPYARYLRSRIRVALGDAPGGFADAAMAAQLYPLQEEYARGRDRLGTLLEMRNLRREAR